jgi:hypothetical protein
LLRLPLGADRRSRADCDATCAEDRSTPLGARASCAQTYIFQRYGIDTYKLKAKVLIGHLRPNEPEVSEKRRALSMYNSHLHRIEVITFDQLHAIGQNVIDANAGESGEGGARPDHDVPF